MSNQEIKINGVNRTETTSCEGVAPGTHKLPDPGSAGHHQATDKTKENEMEKAVKKIVIECWIRSEPRKKQNEQNMG